MLLEVLIVLHFVLEWKQLLYAETNVSTEGKRVSSRVSCNSVGGSAIRQREFLDLILRLMSRQYDGTRSGIPFG